MRRLIGAMVLAVLCGPRAMAQDVGAPDTVRAEELRRQIESRFAGRAREELGLNDDQFGRLRATTMQFGTQRREIERRERQLRQAMAAQLRPGVAANPDSVSRLLDGLMGARTAYVQIDRDELRALSSFLNPVQRAQFYVLRERLVNFTEQVRAQRRQLADPMPRAQPFRRRR
ncbi:MAG: hypothetical protein H0U85_08765 [Gemmatimonadales bacterium]|nr:hypothetical protein [Gemmatimonadales bacterium]